MGQIIFITGGVRSGKSAFAEKYAKKLYKQLKKESLFYIASGVSFDEEMASRINRHKQDRKASDVNWHTIEVMDLVPEEVSFPNNNVVLWDCITTWLSNVLFKTEQLGDQERIQKIESYLEMLKEKVLQWRSNGAVVLLVSNEVLDEASLTNKEVILYRKTLGKLHQWIVSICEEAYEMDYSIIKRWK